MLVILDAAYIANGLGQEGVRRFQAEGIPVALCGDPRDMDSEQLDRYGAMASAAVWQMAAEPTTASAAEALGTILRSLQAMPAATLVISGRGEFMAAAVLLGTRFAWPMEML